MPPLVSAGGNQGLYEVRLPSSLTLQGEVHGNGTRGNLTLTSTWSEVSGPAPVAFTDATSPVTDVVFSAPGTYVLQLEGSDGLLATADRATITVDPAPSLQGASLVLAPSSPGPLTVGTPETLTATLTDAQSHPIGNFVVQIVVTGANPTVTTLATNAAGVATFTYTGAVAGTDTAQATAMGGTAPFASAPVAITWTGVPPVGSIAAQGWIGGPGTQTTIMGLVPITVAPGVTVASGTLSYWPATKPGDTHVLTTSAQGGPGATLATLDTTVLSNGSYIIDLGGTDDHGNQQESEILVTVAGDYKPGRLVVDVPEFTVPVAGIPISVGRRYDSLERDKVGDFGNGWSLTVGHPDLQVDQGNNVTITMPNGRRATFVFELLPEAVGSIVFGFLAQPIYVPEPGVFGTLTSDGCNLLSFNPNDPHPVCFANLFDPDALFYAPTTYKYTDPYGVVYTMGGRRDSQVDPGPHQQCPDLHARRDRSVDGRRHGLLHARRPGADHEDLDAEHGRLLQHTLRVRLYVRRRRQPDQRCGSAAERVHGDRPVHVRRQPPAAHDERPVRAPGEDLDLRRGGTARHGQGRDEQHDELRL